MASDASLADLAAKRRELEALMEQARTDPDESRAGAYAAELTRRGRELEALGEALVVEARAGSGMPGRVEVVLTAAQRALILERTGVDMATYVEQDELGLLAQAMPGTDQRYIEAVALKQAERTAAARAAEQALRDELERTLRTIEEAGVPELSQMVARFRAGG